MTEVVEIKGLRELREALLRKIPLEMHGKVLQQALTAGTAVTVKAARLLAPVKTGRMKRAIYATRDRYGSKVTFESRLISVRHGKKMQKNNRDAYYWKWIEFGRGVVTAGVGKRRGKRTTVLGTPEKGFFGKTVKAAPARPFMRPGFESSKVAAAMAIKDRLLLAIEKAALKARW